MGASQKLDLLRKKMREEGVTAYLIPQTDVHQNEYLPEHYKRLAWLTGFTGSAGLALIGLEKAAVFVDGRYTLQVKNQTDQKFFEPRKLHLEDIEAWLTAHLQAGDILGFDPWLITEHGYKQYQDITQKLKATLKPVPDNLVDAIWSGQPLAQKAPLQVYPIERAGVSLSDKLSQAAQKMQEHKADAAVLTQLDSIAWLLNIRGGDVACAPLALAFAIAYVDQTVDLFIDPTKITADIKAHLGDQVRVHVYEDFGTQLNALGKARKTVIIDPLRAPWQAMAAVEENGGQVRRADDICLMPKACKNAIEIEGARIAHRKDGVALVHFLAWLDQAMKTQTVTEMAIVDKLRAFRDEQGVIDDSFDTITGSGPNGAIVHYHVTPETDRVLQQDELFLLDSGGQYFEGTTDITRTMIFGTPTAEQKNRFTRVLKGHIQLASARFPKGTNGHQLDCLARYALWQAGLDYAHGTGHGVGSFLSVHEGPQRISAAPNTVALQPGMIISNEPGYYKAGAYGIRIENLVVVTPCPAEAGFENEVLCFETLTLVPIDRKLIDITLLTEQERQWINRYHESVREAIGPQIQSFARDWLNIATAAI